MKFLAIEHPAGEGAPQISTDLLAAEARRVWELQQAGVIREIYFNPDHDAVILLECGSETETTAALESLPLVAAGCIRFDVMSLRPYDGFARLFERS
jgi:hypothetical protein